MFEPVIEAGRRHVAKIHRYVYTDIADIPPNERMASSETDAWFKAAKSLVIRAFGERSKELARWEQLQTQRDEEASRAIERGTYNESSLDIKYIHKSMGLLAEFQIYTDVQESLTTAVPNEIKDSLAVFRADHPDPARTVFVMMRFGQTKAHEAILSGIQAALSPLRMNPLRADGKQYHDDLFYNILTYIYGSGYGIAVFERIETEQFNPNVALEVGYMFALRKPVCLLKDRTLATLHADLIGKLYRTFDPLEPIATIPGELSAWLRDKRIPT